MATKTKSAKVKLADMKPQKDAKGGGKKLTNKVSKNLLGGGGFSFGPNRTQQKGNIRRNED